MTITQGILLFAALVVFVLFMRHVDKASQDDHF